MERLEKVAAKPTLILTHYGRKSGKAYTVKINFVVDGERIYLGTADVNRQWVRNVQKTPKIGLLIGGEKFEGEARFLADQAEHQRVQARMRKKYWMYWLAFAITRALMDVGLMKDRTGSFEIVLKDSSVENHQQIRGQEVLESV